MRCDKKHRSQQLGRDFWATLAAIRETDTEKVDLAAFKMSTSFTIDVLVDIF